MFIFRTFIHDFFHDKKKQHLLIIVVASFFLLHTILNFRNTWGRFHWRPSLLEHQVAGTSPGFQTVWVKNNAFGTYLAVVDERIVFAGSFNETSWPSLHSLDSLTGEIQWQVKAHPSGFANDSRFVYTGQGATQIVARDIESGEITWNQRLSGARNLVYMIVTQEEVQALSTTGSYYRVDKRTGASHQVIQGTHVLLIESDVVYLHSHDITAQDRYTSNTIWQTTLNNPSSLEPVFQENLILIKIRQGGGPVGQVHVLDRQTGTVLWETEPRSIVSNVAISNDIAYYLTIDAQLYAVDAYTGNTIGIVNFEPGISERDLVNRRFAVAADGQIIAVYIGDSQQLFVLRFDPSLEDL